MKTRIYILLLLALLTATVYVYPNIPTTDTLHLEQNQVEGRWIVDTEKKEDRHVYVFRADSTFHRGLDNADLLFFDAAGRYYLSRDTIIISYIDFSRGFASRLRSLKLHIVAFSDVELCAYKTDKFKTEFIRLTRRKKE